MDRDSLSLFLCYVVQDLKKYKLFIYVIQKVDVVSSVRSSNEYVKDNNVKKFRVHGLDSLNEEDKDEGNEREYYFSR